MSPVRARAQSQRLQQRLAQLGLASRRQAEGWIRAGRLSVNGRPAVLGMRVRPADQLQLDGRPIRQRSRAEPAVFLCHRSPGAPLLGPNGTGPGAGARTRAERPAVADQLPRRAGRRFIAISPMPQIDGGLELLTADGQLAAQLQRSVRTLESEFSVRVRGELSWRQQQGLRAGRLAHAPAVTVHDLEPIGESAGQNRWYRLTVLGASGHAVRSLLEQQSVTVVRVLRTRLGNLSLPRSLPRGRCRALPREALTGLTP